MNTLSTIWSMWRWKPHCVIWRCFGGLAIRSWSWTATCATLLPRYVWRHFEVVIHDMPRDTALRYVDQLREFYTAGWMKWMEA